MVKRRIPLPVFQDQFSTDCADSLCSDAVHEDDYDTICKKITEYVGKIPVGDGLDETHLIGPLGNAPQLEIVKQYVNDAKKQGARVLCGQTLLMLGWGDWHDREH